MYDGVPRDYPSTQHARASDTASTASGTTSGASSTGSKRAPKALNIGGSSGARKKTATPRNAGAAAATVMVTALGKFRVLDELKEANREKSAAADREVARAHELRIAEMQLRALAPPPAKDLKKQLVELQDLLDDDFITHEEYLLKRKSLLASF